MRLCGLCYAGEQTDHSGTSGLKIHESLKTAEINLSSQVEPRDFSYPLNCPLGEEHLILTGPDTLPIKVNRKTVTDFSESWIRLT